MVFGVTKQRIRDLHQRFASASSCGAALCVSFPALSLGSTIFTRTGRSIDDIYILPNSGYGPMLGKGFIHLTFCSDCGYDVSHAS